MVQLTGSGSGACLPEMGHMRLVPMMCRRGGQPPWAHILCHAECCDVPGGHAACIGPAPHSAGSSEPSAPRQWQPCACACLEAPAVPPTSAGLLPQEQNCRPRASGIAYSLRCKSAYHRLLCSLCGMSLDLWYRHWKDVIDMIHPLSPSHCLL